MVSEDVDWEVIGEDCGWIVCVCGWTVYVCSWFRMTR